MKKAPSKTLLRRMLSGLSSLWKLKESMFRDASSDLLFRGKGEALVLRIVQARICCELLATSLVETCNESYHKPA